MYCLAGNIIEENQYFTIRRIRSEYETHSVKIYKKDLGKTGNEECEDEEQSKILINMAHHEISTIKTLVCIIYITLGSPKYYSDT